MEFHTKKYIGHVTDLRPGYGFIYCAELNISVFFAFVRAARVRVNQQVQFYLIPAQGTGHKCQATDVAPTESHEQIRDNSEQFNDGSQEDEQAVLRSQISAAKRVIKSAGGTAVLAYFCKELHDMGVLAGIKARYPNVKAFLQQNQHIFNVVDDPKQNCFISINDDSPAGSSYKPPRFKSKPLGSVTAAVHSGGTTRVYAPADASSPFAPAPEAENSYNNDRTMASSSFKPKPNLKWIQKENTQLVEPSVAEHVTSITNIELPSSEEKRDFANVSMMKSFDDSLCCKLCFELFQNPVILNCGHSICTRCVKDLANLSQLKATNNQGIQVSCPTCAQNTVSPDADYFSKLPRNFSLEEVIEKQLQEAQQQPMCAWDCGKSAELNCLQCSALFCRTCSGDVHKRAAFKEHVIRSLEDVKTSSEVKPPPAICPTHSRELCLFCNNCSAAICVHCTTAHKGHDMVALDILLASYKNELSNGIRDLRARSVAILQAQNSLETVLSNFARDKEECLKSIDEAFSKVNQALARRRETMINDFNIRMDEAYDILNQQRRAMDVGKHLQNTADAAEKACGTSLVRFNPQFAIHCRDTMRSVISASDTKIMSLELHKSPATLNNAPDWNHLINYISKISDLYLVSPTKSAANLTHSRAPMKMKM